MKDINKEKIAELLISYSVTQHPSVAPPEEIRSTIEEFVEQLSQCDQYKELELRDDPAALDVFCLAAFMMKAVMTYETISGVTDHMPKDAILEQAKSFYRIYRQVHDNPAAHHDPFRHYPYNTNPKKEEVTFDGEEESNSVPKG